MKYLTLIGKDGLTGFVALTVVLGLMILMVPKPGWCQNPVKLGYVDMDKAVNESKAGKEAREKFVAFVQKQRAQIDKKRKALDTMKQILQKQGALLSEDVRVQKEQEYQQKLREYQVFVKNMRDAARTKEMEMSKKIIRQIQEILFSYAKKEHYSMIFEKTRSGLLYATDAMDLTDTIIKIFNQEYSKKK